MIYLITATPGSGKTLWAVNEIFKRVNEETPWNIFSNIDGLKLDSAQELKQSFEDYPARSLVIIDEAQKIPHFSKKYKHPVRNENHPEVEFLQTHRHADFLDIIFITQAPRLLNADVLDMVGTHYHLHRPMGMKLATWWMWKYHQLNPNTKAVKADAEDSGTFTYPKHLFGMYKSSNGGDDSHGKIKIPMKIINAIWMLVLVIGATFYFWAKAQPSEEPKQKVEQKQSISSSIPAVSTPQKTYEEREQERRENFNNELQRVSYNINKPYEQNIEYQYEVLQKPMLSGCVILDKSCTCYTQQATKLDVSQTDCKKYMNGERPFNPFLAESPTQPIQQQQIVQDYRNLDDLARHEQAKEQGLI